VTGRNVLSYYSRIDSLLRIRWSVFTPSGNVVLDTQSLRFWEGDLSEFLAILATTFAYWWKRSNHWYDHCTEFPEIADEVEYERRAAEFLNAPLSPTMVECLRSSDGDTVRYDRVTENFAIMEAEGTIRTFFRPTKSWHGLRSNLEYFQRVCSE
jgi:hypothetical protein